MYSKIKVVELDLEFKISETLSTLFCAGHSKAWLNSFYINN